MIGKRMLSLALGLCFGVSTVLSCSCPRGSFEKDRLQILWEFFTEESNENIYSGVVLEGSCNCIRSQSDNSYSIACVGLSESNGTYAVEHKKTYMCGRFSRVFFGLSECDEIYSKAFGSQTYNISSSGLEIIDSNQRHNCGFRRSGLTGASQGEMRCSRSFQPCSYKILVKEVFKGSYTAGDIVYSDGPDVATSCGRRGMVLDIGETYVIGIGSACRIIQSWTKESSYIKEELDLLKLLNLLDKDTNKLNDKERQ